MHHTLGREVPLIRCMRWYLTKSGLLLYENAQEPLKVPFNWKALNIQAFLNSLLIDVQKYHLEDAVMVTVAGDQVNLITDYGLVTKDAAAAFFNDARKAMITGVDAGGHPVRLGGGSNAAQLLQAHLIQNTKMLFFKLSKLLAPT